MKDKLTNYKDCIASINDFSKFYFSIRLHMKSLLKEHYISKVNFRKVAQRQDEAT